MNKKPQNKIKRLLYILLLSITPLTTYSQELLDSEQMQQIQRLNRAMFYISSSYVDTINLTDLVNSTIRNTLSELDPHSVFISKEDAERDNEMFSGNFEGIGIEFNIYKDTLMVVNVIAGGPAASIGILPGDRIIEANGQPTIGIAQSRVPEILRGPKGTTVKAVIHRKGATAPLIFNIIRDKIPLNSLDVAYYITPEIGYVRLNRFSATTNTELQQALMVLSKAKGLILDLRGNSGGFYDQSIRVTSNFVAPQKLIVYTEGRSTGRKDAFSSGTPLFGEEEGELVVLVDQYSASASEIVAGALQDWDRATIIGRRTFGKGLVQSQIPLGDGSAIRLTVAHYYTPSGRSIQRPYKMGETESYYLDLANRYSEGEITDGKAVVDSTNSFKTLVKGRPVYGGGGILPDLIIPVDTTHYTTYWRELMRQGVILEHVINDLDLNRKRYLESYPDFRSFNNNFVINAANLERLIALGEKKGVKYNSQEMAKSQKNIENYLLALIASRLYDSGDFYKIMNNFDNQEIIAAIDILTKKEK